MIHVDPEILVVICLSSEDEPDEQFLARWIVSELTARQPAIPVILPDEARTSIWKDLDEATVHGCRYIALTLGTIAKEILRVTQARRIDRVLLLGPAYEVLGERLAKAGLKVAIVSATAMRINPLAPAPLIFAEPLEFASARWAVGIPEGHFAVLCPSTVGVPVALEMIDQLALSPSGPDPVLLIFSDQWNHQERLVQRAQLRGLKATLNFCGRVPLETRATLVAACNAVVCSPAFGAYEGFDVALARYHGRQILRPKSDFSGTPASTIENKAAAGPDWASFLDGLWVKHSAPGVASLSHADVRTESSVVVVMPTFECRQFLREAISSVLNQSHPDTHLVVVDDCASDVDGDLIRDHPEVTFLRSPGQIGPYAIANLVIAATQSDLVAFHDADDTSAPERIAAQVDRLLAHQFHALGTNSRVVDLHGALIGVEVRPVDASMQMRAHLADMMLHPTSLMCRSLLDDLGGFDSNTRFGADTEFHLRAALAHDIGNLGAFLYVRLQRPASLTQSPETGFGSDARAAYTQRIREAFRKHLAAGLLCVERGKTLYGQPIPTPDLADVTVLSAGRDAQRWLSPRLAH